MPRRAAVHADALQDLAHPARAGGLQPLPREAALGLQPQVGEGRLVPEPQVLRPLQQPVCVLASWRPLCERCFSAV